MKPRITARKWNGDDCYSWAVFVDRKPAFTGLTKAEVPHYRRLAEKIARQEVRNGND